MRDFCDLSVDEVRHIELIENFQTRRRYSLNAREEVIDCLDDFKWIAIGRGRDPDEYGAMPFGQGVGVRSEEHTSELQSLMRISYAVFCLKKKNNRSKLTTHTLTKS